MMKTTIYIKLFVSVLLIAGISGCSKTSPGEEESQANIPPVNVKVQEIHPHEKLVDSFILHAKVEPNRIVSISAEVAGRIEKILFSEGSLITDEDLAKPLILLKDDLIKAEYDQARSTAQFDKLEFERIKQLFDRGVATASELDKASTTAETSQAELQRQKGRLDRTRIYPPITGTLNSTPVEIGEYVQEGAEVAQIVDSQTVKIVADIPEKDIQYLSLGDPVTLLYSYQGQNQSMNANISLISKLAHARALTTRVEITVDNSDKKFLNGQILRVMFIRQAVKNAVMVPMEIVIPLEYAKAVYVVENNKAVRREVTLGFIQGRDVQITSGLKAGDLVITKGHRYVANGQDVDITAD